MKKMEHDYSCFMSEFVKRKRACFRKMYVYLVIKCVCLHTLNEIYVQFFFAPLMSNNVVRWDHEIEPLLFVVAVAIGSNGITNCPYASNDKQKEIKNERERTLSLFK